MNLTQILNDAQKQKASDIHIQACSPLFFRIDGVLRAQGNETVTKEDVFALTKELLDEKESEKFGICKNFDKAFDAALDGKMFRARANLSYAQSGISLALRLLRQDLPDFETLMLPDKLKSIAEEKYGLLLITGSTGSGKSTTVAAIIDYINQNCCKHIITLEDPVEYIHKSSKSLVTQKEFGKDFNDTSAAVKNALRQDPDIIVIGEIRDAATLQAALTAAETGHLIIATLHTKNAAQTISRLTDLSPKDRSDEIRALLAQTLLAVLSQQLVKKHGQGRALTTELLIATDAAKNLIKEGKNSQLEYVMQTGADKGMYTFAQCKNNLIERGIIAAKQ